MFTANATADVTGKAMSILQKQPEFFVKIDAFGMIYRLMLNGVNVMREDDSTSQITTTLPVNHWMHPTDNVLKIMTLPDVDGEDYNSHAKISYTLMVRDINSEDLHTIASINLTGDSANKLQDAQSSVAGKFSSINAFKPDDEGDVVVSEVSIDKVKDFDALNYTRKIHIPTSLPLWAFFESDDIPDIDSYPDKEYDEQRTILLKEYLKVQDALEADNVDAVMPLFSERNKELDQAFYRTPGETASHLRKSLKESAEDPGLELAPLSEKSVSIYIEDNNKVARLVRGNLGPAVAFRIKTGGSINYDMYFRLNDGKWILTR
jgi:hypothetical protein